MEKYIPLCGDACVCVSFACLRACCACVGEGANVRLCVSA